MNALIRAAGLFCLLHLVSAAAIAEPQLMGEGGPLPMVTPSRTICGANDIVAMKDQEESMKDMGRPVGIYRGNGLACTGTLVSEDLFLTNRHCKVSCSTINVTFGYLARGRQETFGCKEIVEAGSSASNQDYMLVRLNGNPGVEWGFYRLSDEVISKDTPLLMIHHPGASPMKVSTKDCTFVKESGGLLHHRCDTNPGSSGTGILVPDYENPSESRIVGIHAFGGCSSSSTSTNSGPSIRHLSGLSSQIKALID